SHELIGGHLAHCKAQLAGAAADATTIGGFVGERLRMSVEVLASLSHRLLDGGAWSAHDAAALQEQLQTSEAITFRLQRALESMQYVLHVLSDEGAAAVAASAAAESMRGWSLAAATLASRSVAPMVPVEVVTIDTQGEEEDSHRDDYGSMAAHTVDHRSALLQKCFLCETQSGDFKELPEVETDRKGFLDNLTLINKEQKEKVEKLLTISRDVVYFCSAHCRSDSVDQSDKGGNEGGETPQKTIHDTQKELDTREMALSEREDERRLRHFGLRLTSKQAADEEREDREIAARAIDDERRLSRLFGLRLTCKQVVETHHKIFTSLLAALKLNPFDSEEAKVLRRRIIERHHFCLKRDKRRAAAERKKKFGPMVNIYSKLVIETGLTVSLEQLGEMPGKELDEVLLEKMGMSKEKYDRVMQMRHRVKARLHAYHLRLQNTHTMVNTVAAFATPIDTMPPISTVPSVSFPPHWHMVPVMASRAVVPDAHATHTVPSVPFIPFWQLVTPTPTSTSAGIPSFGSIPVNVLYCRTNVECGKPRIG
ncbi:hypothetical protein PFISCL1PPCAC_2805, partial [Pristionchus fissidentatus]